MTATVSSASGGRLELVHGLGARDGAEQRLVALEHGARAGGRDAPDPPRRPLPRAREQEPQVVHDDERREEPEAREQVPPTGRGGRLDGPRRTDLGERQRRELPRELVLGELALTRDLAVPIGHAAILPLTGLAQQEQVLAARALAVDGAHARVVDGARLRGARDGLEPERRRRRRHAVGRVLDAAVDDAVTDDEQRVAAAAAARARSRRSSAAAPPARRARRRPRRPSRAPSCVSRKRARGRSSQVKRTSWSAA